MRWPLRNQLLFPFATVIAAAVVVVSGVDAYLATRRFERQIDEQLDRMAETLRDASFPLTDPVLVQIRGLSGVEILSCDATGRVVHSSGAEPRPAEFRPPRGPALPPGPLVDLVGERYFVRTVEARPGAGSLALHLLYPERTYRETRRQAAWPSLAVGAVALGLVVLAASLVAHRLSRPIGDLGAQVVRIADGDYAPLPLPARDDELRDLAASVNRLAARLAQLTDGLRRSERLALLGQLSGGLAHQLRNAIAGAKIAVQLHRRECPADDRQTLDVALRQLSLVEEQVRSFLTVGETRPPQPVEGDLRDVIAEATSLVEPAARHRGVTLHRDVPDAPLRGRFDPAQIRELLVNLLLNAIDAAGAAPHGRATVVARESPCGSSFLLEVADSGRGPSDAVRDRMFEPFVTGKPEGIGLGLSAARRIAEAHGGRLEFDPRPTTTFRAVLPRAPEAPPQPQQPQPDETFGAAPTTREPRT